MFFLLNLRFFASPYFDHDAFMQHPLHVMDTPVGMKGFQLFYCMR